MRTLHRYALLALGVPIYIWLLLVDFDASSEVAVVSSTNFWTNDGESNRITRNYGPLPCTFQSCFNYSKCSGEQLKVFVYPSLPGEFISTTYLKILTAIKESAFYTTKPEEACIFVLSIDTIDRDRISENYVRDVNSFINQLPIGIWNGGINHVIFNLYHGTFPDYADHNLGFNTGKAIIARASPSVQHFRFIFDVSFPLFHKEHSLRSGSEKFSHSNAIDKYLVSFKGKRYVYGIGSETRDALHHLHGESVKMLTTCRHNNDWKEHQDDRCEQDNEEYEKWDYEGMMANSTFCLTPRGRRLGSFRFLESLRIGCIPVILSDDWVLPFEEKIDWTRAAIVISEENVLLVPDILRQISEKQILKMKEQGKFLYNHYFRDVESITLSALKIVFERIRRFEGYTVKDWNSQRKFEDKSRSNTLVVLGTDDELVKPWIQRKKYDKIDEVLIVLPKTNASLRLSNVKFVSRSKLAFITTYTSAGFFIFVDEKSDLDDIDILLKYLDLNPERLIGTHGIDVDPILMTVNFAKLYNAVHSSTMAINREHLVGLRDAFPQKLLQECFSVALNAFVSETIMQPPIVIGRRQVLPHMQNSRNLECWKKLAQRSTNGFPLHYSDFHYV